MTDHPHSTTTMPNDKRDTESGQFTQKYPVEEFLAAIEKEGGFASTQDVAGHVGCSRPTAYQKLSTLEQEGVVAKRDVGPAVAWSIAEDKTNEDE